MHVTESERAIVEQILAAQVPHMRVRAFGSRVTGRAKKFSDLDLVLMANEPVPLVTLGALSDAFAESDLPYRVDLVDWSTTSPEFRQIIDRDAVEFYEKS